MPFGGTNKLKSYTDEELLTLFHQKGKKKFLGELLNRYTHLVFGVCMKYLKNPEDSRDATMQLFEKLLEDIHRHEIENFRGWLHMVAKNHCLMILRKLSSENRKKREFEETFTINVQSEDELHLFDEDSEEGTLNTLSYCISKLKDDQKTCIEMFYLQEKSYQEIADITHFELKKVKSYIQNGKRNLRICMQENEGIQ